MKKKKESRRIELGVLVGDLQWRKALNLKFGLRPLIGALFKASGFFLFCFFTVCAWKQCLQSSAESQLCSSVCQQWVSQGCPGTQREVFVSFLLKSVLPSVCDWHGSSDLSLVIRVKRDTVFAVWMMHVKGGKNNAFFFPTWLSREIRGPFFRYSDMS